MAKFGTLMTGRSATIVAFFLDAAAWALASIMLFLSGSDQATKGLDVAAGLVVTVLFFVTGVPALILALIGRSPRTALSLALAFPAACSLLFVATVIAFT